MLQFSEMEQRERVGSVTSVTQRGQRLQSGSVKKVCLVTLKKDCKMSNLETCACRRSLCATCHYFPKASDIIVIVWGIIVLCSVVTN